MILRESQMRDAEPMASWFAKDDVKYFFPMMNELECKDAALRWVSFCRYGASVSAEIDGEFLGISTLYLQPYKRLMHNCEMGIIVAPHARGQGVGTKLMEAIIAKAKDLFKIEVLHLQVHPDNPAVKLYERFGFATFGRQEKWIKGDEEGTFHGRLMMEKILNES